MALYTNDELFARWKWQTTFTAKVSSVLAVCLGEVCIGRHGSRLIEEWDTSRDIREVIPLYDPLEFMAANDVRLRHPAS